MTSSAMVIRRTPAALATHGRALLRPSLAASWDGKPGRRSIHLGVGSAVEGLVTWSAHGVSSLHSLGLPWYVSIPLTAVCVNFTLRLPLQYYSRRLLYKQAQLNPLVTAWASRHTAAVPPPAGDAREKFLRTVRVQSLVEKSRSRIYKTWGVQRWKAFAPLLGMFPFVVVSESLRRLSGASSGMIGRTLDLAAESSAAGEAALNTLLDTTLKQGGALWFIDLTAPDPYYLLPVLCSAILARSSWFKMSSERLRDLLSLDGPDTAKAPIVKIQKALGRALLGLPLLPLLFTNLPSAIFLYWAASFSMTPLNDAILERLLPKPPKPEQKPVIRPVLPFLTVPRK